MIDRMTQYWSQFSSPPSYHKVSTHSRNASIDFPGEAEQRLLNTIRTLRRWTFALGVLLTLCLLALGTNIALQHSKEITGGRSPIPRLPRKLVTFAKNDTFSGPSTTETDRAWKALIPPGDGFIRVDQPESYNLGQGASAKDVTGQMYNMAVFHQLHCLTSIREYLWHFKSAVDMNTTDNVRPILLDPQEDHILYCFDYLKQSVMCSGDTTLEWPREEEDGRRTTIDGWGVPHKCVDWDALLELVRLNSFDSF